MERDLSRYHHRRYTDRWRFDDLGVPLLTLREIWVLISDSPPNSAIATFENGGVPRWGTTEHLLADIWGALAGQPHPARPKTVVQRGITAARRRAVRNVETRFERRRRAMGASTE